MTLTYRGIPYQLSQFNVEAQKLGQTVAKYRGQSYQVSNLFVPTQSQNNSFVYRGVA